MKVTNTLKLDITQLRAILVKALNLPESTTATVQLTEISDWRDEYRIRQFGSISLSYETELANVTNKQGSSTAR